MQLSVAEINLMDKSETSQLDECLQELVRVSSRNSSGGSSPDTRSCESSRSARNKPKSDIRNGHNIGSVSSLQSSKPSCTVSVHVPDAHSASFIGSTNRNAWEISSLQKEIETLKAELSRAQSTIVSLQEREQKMKCRLAEQAQKMLQRGAKFENISLGEKRPTALVRQYGNLYAQARVDTLDALDALPALQDADELKSKILFSVIVLAFRSVQNNVSDIKYNIRCLLQVTDAEDGDTALKDLENEIDVYLRRKADTFNLSRNVNEVCSQIYATLYDYPCLKTCTGLANYVKDCVRLSWCLVNQNPPYVIDYEARAFRRDMHVRFHTSSQSTDVIKSYLWPALLEGENGPCVHKGVVLT